MASKTEIFNMSLSHLAIGKDVSNLETEASEEARVGRRFYDTALRATLADFNWPFATKIAALALIEEEPNSEWAFSYRYPSGCLNIRRVLSGVRNDSRQSRAPYKLAGDDTGTIIFTDEEDAQIEYTRYIDNPLIYPADFTLAFSYYLAAMAAPRLTGGDRFKLGEKALRMYAVELKRAGARAVNEEQADEEVDSEYVRARD